MPRANRAALAVAAVAIELLIALAFWWRPEQAMLWATAAGFVIFLALIVEYAMR